MTEEEWQTCDASGPLLDEVLGHWRTQEQDSGAKFNRERQRLFACACCRRVWDLLAEADRHLVEVAERHAFTPLVSELRAARRKNTARANSRHDEMIRELDQHPKGHPEYLLALARNLVGDAVWRAADLKAEKTSKGARNAACAAGLRDLARKLASQGKKKPSLDWEALGVSESAVQAILVRDIFDNSFQPIKLPRKWRSPDVLGLAVAALDERILPEGTLDVTRLGVLADALEEAGCTSLTLLEHLRSPGPHVWGCWAVDLVRGVP